MPYEIMLPFVISNMFGVVFLVLAADKPAVSRLVLSMLFGWAGITNIYVSQATPEVYLEYSDTAWELYVGFINGWFSKHIATTVGMIAVAQLAIAIGLWLKEQWSGLAIIASIIFFLGISPLGIYAAFPFPVIMAIASFFILQKNGQKDLLAHFRNYKKGFEGYT